MINQVKTEGKMHTYIFELSVEEAKELRYTLEEAGPDEDWVYRMIDMLPRNITSLTDEYTEAQAEILRVAVNNKLSDGVLCKLRRAFYTPDPDLDIPPPLQKDQADLIKAQVEMEKEEVRQAIEQSVGDLLGLQTEFDARAQKAMVKDKIFRGNLGSGKRRRG